MEVDSIILRHIGLYPTRDLAELALSKALGAVPVNEIVHPPDGTCCEIILLDFDIAVFYSSFVQFRTI